MKERETLCNTMRESSSYTMREEGESSSNLQSTTREEGETSNLQSTMREERENSLNMQTTMRKERPIQFNFSNCEILIRGLLQFQKKFRAPTIIDLNNIPDSEIGGNQTLEQPAIQVVPDSTTEDTRSTGCSDVDVQGSLVGFTRKTFEEIYDLYKQHASVIGFSVRKHTTRYHTGTFNIIEKNYCCSAEGKTNSSEKKKKKKHR
ncbi:uncharacterized protein [Spinacia oleracea]|uniref:Uncharacterized protein isoform X2 n=1 Tax=Spinacia oleracea TaxID=3562 RepID=A0ABM3RL78_SPIOL|nr:uncharacterized protein LOC130470370 isoform X2 [Spinacia oleracea]